MAIAGIYDLRIHHNEVLAPVLRNLRVFDVTGLSGDGERAREELAAFMAGLDANASRFEERREAKRQRVAARAG
jgi:acyl-[acyl-carrier-protein] desaturase